MIAVNMVKLFKYKVLHVVGTGGKVINFVLNIASHQVRRHEHLWLFSEQEAF